MKKLSDLLAERAQLDAEIAAAYCAERSGILEQIRRVMRDYAITSTELDEGRDRRFGPRSKAPGFLNRVTREMRTGQGRPPRPPVDTTRDEFRTESQTPMHEQRSQKAVSGTSFPELTESEWQCIAPLLPELHRSPAAGRPPADARAVFNGVLWVLYTYAAWSAMPPQYPPHATCHRRFKIWRDSGALRRVVDALPDPRGSELRELIACRASWHRSRAKARPHQDPAGQRNRQDPQHPLYEVQDHASESIS